MKEQAIIKTVEGLTSGLCELTNLVTPLTAAETLPRSERLRQTVANALDAASELISALNDLEEYTFPYTEAESFYEWGTTDDEEV